MAAILSHFIQKKIPEEKEGAMSWLNCTPDNQLPTERPFELLIGARKAEIASDCTIRCSRQKGESPLQRKQVNVGGQKGRTKCHHPDASAPLIPTPPVNSLVFLVWRTLIKQIHPILILEYLTICLNKINSLVQVSGGHVVCRWRISLVVALSAQA